MNVSIIGTTGYGGIELLRILHQHPEFTIQSIHSTKDEVPISHEYPHLYHILNQQIEEVQIEKISDKSDAVFLATPSGVSSKLVEQFADQDIKVIDLSGDLRLKNLQLYKEWYKKEPAKEELVTEAIYGLTEWNEERISHAKLLANPGCYATSALLGLVPVVKEGIIESDSIIVDGKSGTSGAGKSLSKGSLYAEVNENFKIYRVNEHQHTPEIEQELAGWNASIKPITFSTHLLPMTRGIMTTMYVKLTESWKTKDIIELYLTAYENKPFIRVRPEGIYPSVKEVAGSNYCDIGINVDERTGRLTIISVIDNLMKGAAGQAVQNANIMFGYEQTTGLNFTPLYP